MKLSFRSSNYEYTHPTLEVTESEILGLCHRINWCCNTLKEIAVPQADVVPSYGGVACYSNQNIKACQNAAQSTKPRAIKPNMTVTKLAARKAIEEIHRENIRRNLERRLQAARERGDQDLIRLLEAESKQLLV